jgi:hypothetical protein
MKFINLFILSAVSALASKPPIKQTESEEFVNSLDAAIQKYLEQQNNTNSTQQVPSKISKAAFAAPVAKITTEAEARGFIKYAGAAYCQSNSVLNWNCANCNGYAAGSSETVYFSDSNTNTAGYLTVNNDKKLIVLGYRGTVDIVNWLYNLDISMVGANLPYPYNEAGFHNGFNDMTNALLPATTTALKNAVAKYPNHKVVFTGHSLGGAIASLTAYKLAQRGVISWNKINVLTYGQPRIGDPDFAAYLNTKPWTSTRVTSYADLVAISPGRFLGYGHNQYNMHINEDGYTVKCSIYEEDENCVGDHLIPSREAHFTFWDQRMNTKC